MSQGLQRPGTLNFDRDTAIIQRLDLIIELLRTLAKQQAGSGDVEKALTIGPFLNDNGMVYRARIPSEEE